MSHIEPRKGRGRGRATTRGRGGTTNTRGDKATTRGRTIKRGMEKIYEGEPSRGRSTYDRTRVTFKLQGFFRGNRSMLRSNKRVSNKRGVFRLRIRSSYRGISGILIKKIGSKVAFVPFTVAKQPTFFF